MSEKDEHLVSREFLRLYRNKINTYEQTKALLGAMYADQMQRSIGSTDAAYAGQRTELDYSKYANFLRPNEKWTEPLLMFTGLAVDDFSGVIKSLTTTVAPSARDCVRLYRRSVLPKSMWLPERSMHLARNWDAFGTERIVAIDNGLDLVSDMALYMFLDCGAIPLRMPPNRGDYKGSIERTIKSFETMFVSSLNGFVNAKFVGFDKRYRRIRERARAQADETVRSYEEKAAKFCNDYNHMPHPKLKKPRIEVYRDSQEQSPIWLPSGKLHLRSTFAITYEATLGREGVQVATWRFNSHELTEHWWTHKGKVIVKLDPDDVRSVLVLIPGVAQPIEAFIQTHRVSGFKHPVSHELLRITLARRQARGEDLSLLSEEAANEAMLDDVWELQNMESIRTEGKTVISDAQAVAHADRVPSSDVPTPTAASRGLSEILKDTQLDDEV